MDVGFGLGGQCEIFQTLHYSLHLVVENKVFEQVIISLALRKMMMNAFSVVFGGGVVTFLNYLWNF